MGIEKEFNDLVYTLNKQKKEDIFSFEFKNQKYWLKKARATKSTFIHKVFYKFFLIQVLIPVENKTEKDSLDFETNKIVRLKQKGIRTPEIKIKNESFFVLGDSGEMVHSYIRKKDISKEKIYYYIDLMLKNLALIHNNHEYHGGPQSRNFLYKDGKITAIDFEDSFDENIDLKVLQFRDFILFLLSLTKTKASFEIDYNYVIKKYIELVPQNKDFRSKLKTLAKKISFFITFSQNYFINKLIGKDGQGFFKLFLILKNLKG